GGTERASGREFGHRTSSGWTPSRCHSEDRLALPDLASIASNTVKESPAAVTALATMRRRRITGLLLLIALLGLTLIASVAIGTRSLAPSTVYDALDHALSCADGPFRCAALSTDEEIVRGLRLPRTVLALVTGIALGMAGALIQGYTRNPLADAGLLGLNAGAAFLAALSMYLFAFTAPEQYIW